MTLREILAKRAKRHMALAESRKSASRFSGRKLRRESLEERKQNHFIESRENMIKRNHYILVEDENDNDLVEIETVDTEEEVDTGKCDKEDLVKSLEAIAAQLGLKVVASDDDEKEEDDNKEDSEETEEVEAEVEEKKESCTENEEQPSESEVVVKDEEKEEVTTEAEDDVKADSEKKEEDKSDADDVSSDEDSEKSDEDDETEISADAEENSEEIAKKLSDLTPSDWLDILAKIEIA